jgi:hypothetical protein
VDIVLTEGCGSLSDVSDTSAAVLAVYVRTVRRSLDVRRMTDRVPGRGERVRRDGGRCLSVMIQARAVEPAVSAEMSRTNLRLEAIWGCS